MSVIANFGPRLTGKNAKIMGVLARTTVSSAAAMTDGGAHTVYTLVVSSVTEKYWNPNFPPAITLQTAGSGPFNAINPSLYTVDYIAGTVTFLVANGASDVVKINSIEYMTLQQVGSMSDWVLNIKTKNDDATAFQDKWEVKLATFLGWTGSAGGYHVSSFWYDQCVALNINPEFYLSFYPDAAGAEYFIGAVASMDFGIDVKKDKTIAEKLTFQGTGVLGRLTS